MFFALVDSALSTRLYFLSHFFTPPLHPPNSSAAFSHPALSLSLALPCLLIQLGARAPLHCHYTLICSLCFVAVGVILQSGVEAIIN